MDRECSPNMNLAVVLPVLFLLRGFDFDLDFDVVA